MNTKYNLIHADTEEHLKTFKHNTFHTIITDPPYEINITNQHWDKTKITYSVNMWKQCERILKPGGWLACFSAPRTYHKIATAIENAGFTIIDQILWIYASGFPHGFNPQHHMKHKHKYTKKQKNQLNGYNTALKPAHEPIILAKKQADQPITETALTHNTGLINTKKTGIKGKPYTINKLNGASPFGAYAKRTNKEYTSTTHDTRYPANIITDGSKTVENILKNTAKKYFYCAKPNKTEKNEGLNNINNHPTVKPLALMTHLVILLTQPNNRILDPFMGTGTTGLAALQQNIEFTGIEKEKQYYETAQKRIKYWTRNNLL